MTKSIRPRSLALMLLIALLVGAVTSQLVTPLLVPPVHAANTPRGLPPLLLPVVPPARPNTDPPRWEYLCAQSADGKKLQKWANGAGAEGWELAAAAGGAEGGPTFLWCFKRRRP